MKQYKGFTLIEVILVLVVIGSILVAGLKMYFSFRTSSNAAQVQANVDAIFQGMASYYKAQCYGQTPNQTAQPGTLNPASSPANNVVIDMNKDLIKNGYLSASAVLSSPLVSGYVLQFNQAPAGTRMACDTGTGLANSSTCSNPVPVGTVTSWQAQVAVQLSATPASSAADYLGLMAGDCLSTLSGTIVTPCTTTTTGTYVVWERTISNASKQGGSTYWQTMPIVKQFTQQYSAYPTNYLCGN